jgi:hypothetical protein
LRQAALIDQPGWMICEAIFRLVASRAVAIDHRALVITTPDRRVCAQINGLASEWDGNAGCWKPVPIGYTHAHRLRVYLTGDWSWEKGQVLWRASVPPQRFYLSLLGTDGSFHADLTDALQEGLVDVAAGLDGRLTGHGIKVLLSRARAAAIAIGSGDIHDANAIGQPYPKFGLGLNSNTVARTLRLAMGLAPAPKGFGGWAPGYSGRLLAPTRLAEIAANRQA